MGGTNDLSNLIALCPVCHSIAHGEYQLDNQFPFDQQTARDAIAYYLSAFA
jgi:predicted HNH restriction endonuclease